MPQSQRLSSIIPFVAIGRPACPKCKAPIMLVSIEPARVPGRRLAYVRMRCLQSRRPLPRMKTLGSPRVLDVGFKAIWAVIR